MVELMRTVRFAVNDSDRQDRDSSTPGWNTFSGYPSMRGLGRHYELEVTCLGSVDPVTGYFINIKEIDNAVRAAAIPMIARACRENPSGDPSAVLMTVMGPLDAALKGRLKRARWRLTPYYSIEMERPSPGQSQKVQKPFALLRQQFEFAASHRLHSRHLSDQQNRSLYGKCNNPSGHGHNYRVEPCVAVPVGGGAGAPQQTGFSLGDLERLTHDLVIQRFDHKHLNLDTAEFGCGSADEGKEGLSPSVENIAKVCFELLEPAIADLKNGASLRSVTVWETDKTSCTYPSDATPTLA
ncbi:MAG: 6-carboxytetrahydropterin synthase [Pyrinomonadaceae bacterium]|nr:6-carboxytetrahydropterin synthase [Phycisphaerales bacterium]